jgi:hypothetical protein
MRLSRPQVQVNHWRLGVRVQNYLHPVGSLVSDEAGWIAEEHGPAVLSIHSGLVINSSISLDRLSYSIISFT